MKSPKPPASSEGDPPGRLRQVMADSGHLQSLLHQREEDNTDFFATLAHELRNPLAPIRSALHVLRVAESDHAMTAAACAMIERQLAQLIRLIDDLADVAHAAHGKLDLHRERVQLAAVVQQAIEANRALLESKQLHVGLALPVEPVWLYVDGRRLVQVLANILNNSAKYSDLHGEISIQAVLHDDRLRISVRDQGVGIAPDQLPHVFEMFTHNRRSAGDLHKGLGVGLTLARWLVELHGGKVEARSEGAGRGATFSVDLDLSGDPAFHHTEPPTVAHGPASARTSARILIVDDNRDGAQSLALMLDLEGHEIRTAGDGLEALQVAESFRPQVVLLDIGMPGMDGYETARRLRARPWARSTLLCAQTGWGQEDDRRKARDAGFDQYFVKPLDPQVLSELLATLSGSHSTGGTGAQVNGQVQA